MKKPASVVCVLAAVVLAVPAVSFAGWFGAGVEARSWASKLDGDLKVDTKGILGSTIDAENDLDMDVEESVYEFEAWIELPIIRRLNFSYVGLENEGAFNLTKSITFDGQTFNATERVTSSLEVTMMDATMERPFPFIGTWGPVSANLILGAKFFDFTGSLGSTRLGTIEESAKAPVPEVGASLRFKRDWLQAYAGAKGVALNIQDVSGKVIDARAAVGVGRWGFWLSGGYRYFLVDLDADDAELDLKYTGPYVGLSYEF